MVNNKKVVKKKKMKVKPVPPPAPKGNQYAKGCETSGRPRDWTEDMVEKVRKNLEEWIEDPKNFFFTGFLNKYNVHPQQIERFCNYSPEFRETHAKALRIQEERLVNLAVFRKGDGGFIKFILANKAGWKEKSEVSGDAANPLAIILDRIGQSARDPLDYDE